MKKLLRINRNGEIIKYGVYCIDSIENNSSIVSIDKRIEEIKKGFPESEFSIFEKGTPEYSEHFDPKIEEPDPIELRKQAWNGLSTAEEKINFLAKQLKLIDE